LGTRFLFATERVALTNYVHASAVHGNKLTVMYAPVGGQMRGYEGGGDDEEEKKNERLRPREMLSLSTPINSDPVVSWCSISPP